MSTASCQPTARVSAFPPASTGCRQCADLKFPERGCIEDQPQLSGTTAAADAARTAAHRHALRQFQLIPFCPALSLVIRTEIIFKPP